MTRSSKLTILLAVLAVIAGALLSQVVNVEEEGVGRAHYTTNAGELTGTALVGQTFTSPEANLAGIGVMFATYSNRTNTAPILFHLRDSLEATTDLRTAEVHPSVLRDNQIHRFQFDPLPESANRTYFFYVNSPTATPGNAVTIDLNTQDPYHLGTAFLIRDGANAPPDPVQLARAGKQTADVAFATYHRVPLRVAIVHALREEARVFVGSWDENRSWYFVVGKLVLPVGVLVVLLIGLRREYEDTRRLKPTTVLILLGGLLVAGILWRTLYATNLPLTYDEGNYLYDARTLRQGALAGGDGYVKAPLVIVWISLWQLIAGDTIMAGRFASVLISTLTLIPLYFTGRELWQKRTGIMAAALWALTGVTAVFGIYVHTQPLALFFATAGIGVLWAALRGRLTHHHTARAATNPWWFIGAGALLGLGVASRKSILAVGLVPLILIATESKSWRERLHHYLLVGAGFLLVMVAFLGVAWAGYGVVGIQEAIGLNSAEDGITATNPDEADQVREYSLRGMTPFFRESLPLILLSLLGWGTTLETLLRALGRRAIKHRATRAARIITEYLGPKLGWVLPLAVAWWCYQFFWEYEGGIFLTIGHMPWLWYAMLALIAGVALWPRPRSEETLHEAESVDLVPVQSTQPRNTPLRTAESAVTAASLPVVDTTDRVPDQNIRALISASLLGPAWVGGLVFFYMNWIKFHANYIGEFLVPLTILSGLGALATWQRLAAPKQLIAAHPLIAIGRRIAVGLFVIVVAWSLYLGNYITYHFEHTGTFTLGSLAEAAAWARQHIPLDQAIFTGAAAIPYLSGHHTVLDIAHPRWYAYEFTRKDPVRLNTFLPPAAEMVEAFRTSQWVLREQQTGFSFLMEYTEIEQGIERSFTPIHGVENGSNTLTFLQRSAAHAVDD